MDRKSEDPLSTLETYYTDGRCQIEDIKKT